MKEVLNIDVGDYVLGDQGLSIYQWDDNDKLNHVFIRRADLIKPHDQLNVDLLRKLEEKVKTPF